MLVFLLPRAGWALAATAGAVALAIDGQVGSAMFLVLPAVVAALAAMVPLPRVFDGALAGAGAFAWVVAVQAMSGTSLALSMPDDRRQPGGAAPVRRHRGACDACTFAQPAYTASLGLWVTDRRRCGSAGRPARRSGRAGPRSAARFLLRRWRSGQVLRQPVPTISIVGAGLVACAADLRGASGRAVRVGFLHLAGRHVSGVNFLKNFESKLERLIEGGFKSAFKSEVQPIELARKLSREMDAHRAASISRTYAPNEYTVFLSPQDREQFAHYEDGLQRELSLYLLEHARKRGYSLISRPTVDFDTDDRLELGLFGIQARLADAPEEDVQPVEAQPPTGHTQVYNVRDLQAPPTDLDQPQARRSRRAP